MCEPVSITMAVMAVAGAAMSAHGQAKAEGAAEDSRRKGQIQMVKQMNMANADLSLEAKDKYDQAQQQLTDINLKSLRNRGLLNAAIGESGIAGNSMSRIKRVTQAETDRERVGVMDNYQRDYQTIFANQVGNVENTKAALKGSNPVLRTSKVAQALNVVNAGVSGYAQGSAIKGQMNANKAAGG